MLLTSAEVGLEDLGDPPVVPLLPGVGLAALAAALVAVARARLLRER